MRISTLWLRELLPGLTLASDDIARELTLHSYETNVVERRQIDSRVRVVRVVKLEPHPNADRLRLATVTDGTTTTQVVCGAPNITEEAVVPYAPPGAIVLNEDGKPWVLTKTKIRGVESPGMLTSARELGLSTSHAGILILPSDTPLGTPLCDHIPNDDILEADITRNRASDSLGHLGIARELGSLLKLPVREPETLSPLPTTLPDWSVRIADPELASRYIGGAINSVVIEPSPLWLQARLFAVGVRPINNVIDITNYVLWEYGYPTHAFDRATLGHDIGVRVAHAGEKIITLDGVERILKQAELVITSGDEPIALAGIMGGRTAEIAPTTSEIWLEVANFSPQTIQHTVGTQGLRTDAAARWVKGIDPNQALVVMGRLAYLLTTFAQGTVQGIIDVYPRPRLIEPIAFRPERAAAIAGQVYPVDQILEALHAIYCEVNHRKVPWQVTPPSWRLDLTQEYELVEEVIRLIGLDGVPAHIPAQSDVILPPAEIRWREAMRDVLAKWGMNETYNYSFEISEWATVTAREQTPLTLKNPIAPERTYLRRSLLPGLLANLAHNKSEFRLLQLFEIGAVYYQGNDGVVDGVHEERQLAGVIWGTDNNQAKANVILEQIMSLLGIADITMQSAQQQPWDQAAQVILHRGEIVGYVGPLEPLTVAQLRGSEGVVGLVLNLDRLCQVATNQAPTQFPEEGLRVVYESFSKYPPVFRDISVVVPSGVTMDAVWNLIEAAGKELVADVDLFDIYGSIEDWHQPGMDRSMAFHIKYQSSEKTLTDAEIAVVHQKITEALTRELGATVR